MKDKILKLRNEGKSYAEIKRILGCSKGTISYHCGLNQKDKHKKRLKRYKKTLNGILKRKKDNFSFANGNRQGPKRRVSLSFSHEDFKNKLLSSPTCYLTGRKIDLFSPKTYNCDHMIPICRGGSCELNNMGLTCKEANMAKAGLTIDEFIDLCKEVLVHNGFSVDKKI